MDNKFLPITARQVLECIKKLPGCDSKSLELTRVAVVEQKFIDIPDKVEIQEVVYIRFIVFTKMKFAYRYKSGRVEEWWEWIIKSIPDEEGINR